MPVAILVMYKIVSPANLQTPTFVLSVNLHILLLITPVFTHPRAHLIAQIVS